MGAVVAFDYAAFQSAYPSILISQDQAQEYFNMATIFHRNDGGGPVSNVTIQASLLNMMVAHLATLLGPQADGSAASPLVGRVSSATEGSVTVMTEYAGNPTAAQAWLFQTKYGAMYYQATRPYRTMRYLPNNNAASATVVGPQGAGWAYPGRGW